jgi:hypothetical protein
MTDLIKTTIFGIQYICISKFLVYQWAKTKRILDQHTESERLRLQWPESVLAVELVCDEYHECTISNEQPYDFYDPYDRASCVHSLSILPKEKMSQYSQDYPTGTLSD